MRIVWPTAAVIAFVLGTVMLLRRRVNILKGRLIYIHLEKLNNQESKEKIVLLNCETIKEKPKLLNV